MERKDIELIAPAGSYESLMAAIQGGADAVYFGVEKLNMRARSSFNFTIEDLENWVINVIGTDVSRDALSLAKKGIYNHSSMKYTSEDTIKKYFEIIQTPNGKSQYKIKDKVKKITCFSYINLVEDFIPYIHRFSKKK